MKKIFTTIFLIIILALSSFIYSNIDKQQSIYDKKIETNNFTRVGPIANKSSISQTFVCQEDLFDGVYFKCTLNDQDVESILYYKLIDSATNKNVITGKFNVSSVENNKFFKIKFPQLKGCEGKKFEFIIYDKGLDENQTISLYSVPQIEKNTELKINDIKNNGTLVFRTLSHRFDLETFCVVIFFILYIVLFIKILIKLFK